MFDNRCMYYLTIVVVMLFSVSFIKLNKFWELDVRYGEVESDESMGTTIFKGVRFLIGIVLQMTGYGMLQWKIQKPGRKKYFTG